MKAIEKKQILVTQHLSVGYENNLLFQELELVLNTGELVCFMGPNGAGKSTLIRTLSGLQNAVSGRISLIDPAGDSHNIDTKPNHLLSVVLTDKINAAHMTVYELVTFGRYPYLDWNVRITPEDRQHIESALEKISITHLANRRLYELSDGQVQMSMIARALAQDTPLIILDEPTAHLDLNNRVEIMKLLRQLTRSLDKAILLATHDLDLALQTADRIWLTGNDKNVIEGIPEDLVLNGSFDTIFKFKGFDLKTGKVQHQPFRKPAIHLKGEGYAHLWTKNALERNGYEVDQYDAGCTVEVKQTVDMFLWSVDNNKASFDNLASLLQFLDEN
ncbi:MAG TPA: ABC transporter ATP-binding protein [Ohtaekwangia sp.]|nr:ABC transporter ATP-binding protein [Ohtaekwangia sp.]